MSKNTETRHQWSKPQLSRLGQIKDVAGKPGPGSQSSQGDKT